MQQNIVYEFVGQQYKIYAEAYGTFAAATAPAGVAVAQAQTAVLKLVPCGKLLQSLWEFVFCSVAQALFNNLSQPGLSPGIIKIRVRGI